MVTTDDKTQ
jgi:hypothetical protein